TLHSRVFWFVGIASCTYCPSKSPFIFRRHPALAICLESSFWYQSSSISFIDAFRKAFAIYTETGTQGKVKVALDKL
ncbi:hypothetical protein H4582DRAFT_1984213, partial [Lactarius indigo]